MVSFHKAVVTGVAAFVLSFFLQGCGGGSKVNWGDLKKDAQKAMDSAKDSAVKGSEKLKGEASKLGELIKSGDAAAKAEDAVKKALDDAKKKLAEVKKAAAKDEKKADKKKNEANIKEAEKAIDKVQKKYDEAKKDAKESVDKVQDAAKHLEADVEKEKKAVEKAAEKKKEEEEAAKKKEEEAKKKAEEPKKKEEGDKKAEKKEPKKEEKAEKGQKKADSKAKEASEDHEGKFLLPEEDGFADPRFNIAPIISFVGGVALSMITVGLLASGYRRISRMNNDERSITRQDLPLSHTETDVLLRAEGGIVE